jgi:hypothetical protein
MVCQKKTCPLTNTNLGIKAMLWKTAKYMHVVPGFIFPKYLSDAFGLLHKVMSTKLDHNPEELHQFTYLTFFYASATLDEITKHGDVLIPGRYFGAEEGGGDGELFFDKIARFTKQVHDRIKEGRQLDTDIRKNCVSLGFKV